MSRDEQIAEELNTIQGKDQLLLPEEVVTWAREHRASALHKCFTWDNSEAAEQYRLIQARRVLALRIIPGTHTRQLVSLSIDRANSGGYRTIESVMKKESLRKILLRDALMEFNRVRKRYADLNEFAEVYKALDKVQLASEKKAA